tara:strand:- start:1869 stop:2189 length:321 start_codon:yes stop_codon:yes gene_type:complete
MGISKKHSSLSQAVDVWRSKRTLSSIACGLSIRDIIEEYKDDIWCSQSACSEASLSAAKQNESEQEETNDHEEFPYEDPKKRTMNKIIQAIEFSQYYFQGRGLLQT